ncbi:MAG: hypothetical protein ACPGUD_00770 [Parashewanella sp.]
MDFRLLVIGLLLWVPNVFSSPMTKMDSIVPLISQYPHQAKMQLAELEQQFLKSPPTAKERLRTQLLNCYLQVELGEYQAAINIANLGEAHSKQLKLFEARPYFLTCMADAYNYMGNYDQVFPLLDTAVNLAKKHHQTQALIDALRVRGTLDTHSDNFVSAIEDIRISIDLFPSRFKQKNNWYWPTEAYVYATMATLFDASGELANSMEYIKRSLKAKDAQGTVQHKLLLNSAAIHFKNKKLKESVLFLKEAKRTIVNVTSEFEKAYSYAIIATLELSFGNLEKAEQFLLIAQKVFKKYHKYVNLMRSERIHAQILFAKGEPQKAISKINSAIEKGTQLNKHFDLHNFYQILQKHYSKQGDFQQAYQYLLKAYSENTKANKVVNSARFIQYKARLDRQASLHSQDRLSTPEIKSKPILSSNAIKLTIIGGVLFGSILLLVCFNHRRQVALESKTQVDTPSNKNKLEKRLTHAKVKGQPLSLLMVNVEKVTTTEMLLLEQSIQDVLREQDLLIHYSDSQLLIVLNKTSNAGCHKVVRQLQINLAHSKQAQYIFGQSSMQQFDNVDSLIKRATLDWLTQCNNREMQPQK